MYSCSLAKTLICSLTYFLFQYSLYILVKSILVKDNNIQLKVELENEKKMHENVKKKLQEYMTKNYQLTKELEEVKKTLRGKIDLIHSFANNLHAS